MNKRESVLEDGEEQGEYREGDIWYWEYGIRNTMEEVQRIPISISGGVTPFLGV